jgi:hypothetical protein
MAKALRPWLILLITHVLFTQHGTTHAQGALPSVWLTAPANNSTVTRTVLVAANATAGQGVASVQFQLDGVALSGTISASGSTYSMSWDTTAAGDGPHTLSAVVIDKSNNQTTSSISTTVSNHLQLNQRIQTVGNVNVYGTPSLSGGIVGKETTGALGTIVGGPSSDGQNNWWQINYDNRVSGWSTDNILQPLPLISITPNTWIPVQPTFVGAPNGGQLYPQGWGNKGAYDPITHRVILSDRWADPVRGYISIFANGIYAFDPALNVFTVVKLSNWYAQTNSNGGYTTTALPANTTDPTPPDHHPLQAVEVVPQMNAVYTVNGVNSISLPDPSILNKTWKLDFGTHTWTVLSQASTDSNYPPNNPSNTSGLIYEPTNNKLVYLLPTLCGCNGTVTYLFDVVANTWSILPQDASSLPVNISGAGVTYDSKRDLIVAYGGNNYNTATGTTHLWAYSVVQNKWNQLADAPVTGTAPAFSYDSVHDIFLALVGNNTYIYNPNTNTWAQYPATLNRPMTAQTWQGVTFDPAHKLFVFEGGAQNAPLIALFRYDPNVAPTLSFDTAPPTVSMTSPTNNATVTGTITVSATASDAANASTTDSVGITGVQFLLDGSPMSGINAGSGPSFSIGWNTAGATNGTHTLSATAYDEPGNTATSSISITVSNAGAAPSISGVTSSSITASGAVINWTTDQASDSQVAYGLTSSYGSRSTLGPTLVTSHSVILSGLAAGTAYHYQALSRNSSGLLGVSGDFTFTTAASQLSPLFLLRADASEVSGLTNGSTITPSVAPSGLSGNVIVTGSGSVNYTPSQTGNGVYFLNCCSNTNRAYYKFTGQAVGNVFNASQGQVTFYLKSRYSFAQRQTSAASPRYAFDVRDATTSNHLFFFQTQISSGNLLFGYRAGGNNQFYYVPHGTEDTLFGLGVIAKVTIIWGGSVTKLYLNNSLVQVLTDTSTTPSWTSASNFDIGAYEYLNGGGFNVDDDIIDEFSVSGPATAPDSTPPTISMTAPANGATFSGSVPVSANATDNGTMSNVQFQLDGTNLGAAVFGAGPSYQISWDTTTATSGGHTLTAVATDSAGLKTTSASISVTVSNVISPPAISAVSANPTSSSSATISWTTTTASNSQVAYGLTSSYGTLSALGTALVTSHSVTLSGLQALTTYHYQVQSTDSSGNLSSSADFMFTTLSPPAISAVSAGSPSSSGTKITWTTSTVSNSQVAYGLTSSYGTLSGLGTALVTSHSVTLTGLQPSTLYHYQVQSTDSSGNLSTSADFTFTTAAVPVGPQPIFLLHADATEVSGITNGSTVTPSTGPTGLSGSVVVKGTGSVNFAAAQVGNGVYFLNCCANTNTAYYKFSGMGVGAVFPSTGQATLYLESRYTFAQRKTSAPSARFAFDVRDNNASNHVFYFLTQISQGFLVFSYRVGNTTQFYFVPAGTEDSLFGNGVILKVGLTWDGSTMRLYLNNAPVQSTSYTITAPNWSSASVLDIGAYEYLSYGGFNVSDDIIDEFILGPLQ